MRRSALSALLLCSPVALADGFECLIEPSLVIEASTAMEGVIERIDVHKGDLVTAGQLLATLESKVERAALEHARARASTDAALRARAARVKLAEKKLDRATELSANNFISSGDHEELETEWEVARLSLAEECERRMLAALEAERVAALLDMRAIRSPVAGVVVERYLGPGEFAKAKPILKLARIDPLYVEVVLPLDMYGRVQVGSAGTVLPEAPLDGRYAARVITVDRVVDAASGTFTARLELPNEDLDIPAGIGCRALFDLPQIP